MSNKISTNVLEDSEKQENGQLLNNNIWYLFENTKKDINSILSAEKQKDIEIEIKILEINKDEIIKKLEELWAELRFSGIISDVHFKFEDTKWAKLRIRKKQKDWKKPKFSYTIKRKLKSENGAKISDEIKWKIENMDEFFVDLEKFGLKYILEKDWNIDSIKEKWLQEILDKKIIYDRKKEKHRTSYVFEDARFDIDEYDWIPVFMEIEANSTDKINDYIKILWLENYKTSDVGSKWLFKIYGKKFD